MLQEPSWLCMFKLAIIAYIITDKLMEEHAELPKADIMW